MKKIIALTLMSLALIGCAPPRYFKQGASPETFQKDKDYCNQVGWSGSAGNPLIANSIFNDCMKGKGWEQQH